MVQGLPSSHPVPFGASWVTQAPLEGWHAVTRHPPEGGQVTTVVGSSRHAPSTQRSEPLQRLSSSWIAQSSSASHTHTGSSSPVHSPSRQVSPREQGSLSLQGPPDGAGVWAHPVSGSQVSTVHGLSSLHVVARPPTQLPSEQKVSSVQALPSSHGAWSSATITTQDSLVHTARWQTGTSPLAQSPSLRQAAA
jgi:hypothetical protein